MHPSYASQLAAAVEAYAKDLRLNHPLLSLAQNGQLGARDVANYLMNIRFMIQHTPLHLVEAKQRATQLGQHELADFYAQKLQEEAGHDVWATSDLSRLNHVFGFQPAEALSQHMQDLAHFNERLIANEPSHYLAYILFSEYLTVLLGPLWVRALTTHCGIPADALSVVSQHVELDQAHVRGELARIDELLAGNPVVMFDALHSAMRYFRSFCDELYAAATTASDSAAVAAE
jgi:pyrroloquinoline quinone (PQQ) biosynthesis protein C